MEKITALVDGLDSVFFCNSGTESVEAAIKFAAHFHRAKRGRRRHARLPRADDGITFRDVE